MKDNGYIPSGESVNVIKIYLTNQRNNHLHDGHHVVHNNPFLGLMSWEDAKELLIVVNIFTHMTYMSMINNINEILTSIYHDHLVPLCLESQYGLKNSHFEGIDSFHRLQTESFGCIRDDNHFMMTSKNKRLPLSSSMDYPKN